MAIKLFRKDLSAGTPAYAEVPDMLDIEIGSGEELSLIHISEPTRPY